MDPTRVFPADLVLGAGGTPGWEVFLENLAWLQNQIKKTSTAPDLSLDLVEINGRTWASIGAAEQNHGHIDIEDSVTAVSAEVQALPKPADIDGTYSDRVQGVSVITQNDSDMVAVNNAIQALPAWVRVVYVPVA